MVNVSILLENLKEHVNVKSMKNYINWHIKDGEEVKFISYLNKLVEVIKLFDKKMLIVDDLLRNWNGQDLNELKKSMNALKKTILEEWGDLSQCKAETEKLKELYKDRSWLLLEQFKDIVNALEWQIKYSSEIEERDIEIEIKKSFIKLVGEITREYRYITGISQSFYFNDLFKIKTGKDAVKKLYNVETVTQKMLDLNEAIQKMTKHEKSCIASFMNQCLEFIKKNNIRVVLVTETSARILGIILLNKLRENKIKNTYVASFVPGKDMHPSKYIEKFSSERRALTKQIRGNNILILDEFMDTGRTLASSKYVFERIGANKVYTCACLINPHLGAYEIKRIDFFGCTTGCEPSWYNKKLLGRSKKYVVKEGFSIRPQMDIRQSLQKDFFEEYKVAKEVYLQLIADYRKFMKTNT